MTGKYNPLAIPAIPLEIVKQHFGPGSDSRKASRLYNDNPGLYKAMKAVAVEHDLIHEEKSLSQQHRELHGPKTLSAAEEAATKLFTREQVDYYFRGVGQEPGSADNLNNIKRTDLNKFKQLELAAKAYGVINPALIEVRDNTHDAQLARQREQERVVESDTGKFTISDQQADLAGVPRGTRVTPEQFGKLCQESFVRSRAQSAQPAAPATAPAPVADAPKPADDGDNNKQVAN